jgi:Lar family restriction alleviation protein
MELKPCPFCGGEAETKMYLWGHHAETHAPIWCYYVYCVSCDAMTDNIFKSKKEAIAAWNRRAEVKEEQP